VVHVLLIEDDATIRQGLVRALGEHGHAVTTAPTGAEGLRLALADHPDLVVLDLGLPDLDGREVLTMLRAVSEVPVIVATARDAEQEIVAALESGADDYLVKPFGGTSCTPGSVRYSGARRPTPTRIRRSRSADFGSIPGRGRPPSTGNRSTSPHASSTCCTTSPRGRARW
jgi:CheY-like chemotaxis protein